MKPDEFRALGHALVEWVATYRERLPDLPVMSQAEPGQIKRQLPETPPEQGSPPALLLEQLNSIVLPGITHWNHPRFFAYFPSNTDLAAALADLVISGLGAQGMSWQTSPAATEIEEVMMDWLRQMVGLPGEFTGVIHDSASTATLAALLCARERTTAFGQARGGLQEEEAPLVVYASEMAHSSIDKAALLAGFGRDNLRLIETDETHALRPERLAEAIEADLAAGKRPCAVVATTGSTATTAMDPIRGVASIAQQHNVWLHVDAALAGAAMVVPECRALWDGIEHADSLVWNPHKWLGVGFDCSAYFVRDAQHLIRVMSTNPSYLQTAQDGSVKNLRDWGIPLGRRFRALKVWFLIHEQGVEAIRERIRRDLAYARWLSDQVDADPAWERAAPTVLQTVCLRHAPPGLAGRDSDAHNLAIAERVNKSGRAYITPTLLKGRQILRVSFGTIATQWPDVEAVWRELRDAATALAPPRAV
jgi:aromatic-L-amino-acid/L-tryptophan decarboxylase